MRRERDKVAETEVDSGAETGLGHRSDGDRVASSASARDHEDETAFDALMRRVKWDPTDGAFLELYDAVRDRLLRRAYRLLGTADSAETAVQDALLKVYRYRLSFRDDGRFWPWMLAILERVCHDVGRRAARRPAALGLEDVAEPADPEPASAAAEADPRIDSVREAIASLPERQQRALALRLDPGLSYREIGDVLGCSAGAVGEMLFRARRAIRRAVGRAVPPGGSEVRS